MESLKALRQNYADLRKDLQNFISYETGSRVHLPGFEGAQQKCLDAKALIRDEIFGK